MFAVFATGDVDPSLVIKIDRQPVHKARLRAEFAALSELDERPQITGRVPRPLAFFDVGRFSVLAQTGVPGVPLNVVLRRRLRVTRRRCEADQGRVLGWLADLQDVAGSREVASAPLDGGAAVARMQAILENGPNDAAPFLRAMSRQAERWQGVSLPMTPGHGDFGPSNCLITPSGEVGVIDWEGGVGLRSPLVDLVVFLHHYARALPTRRQLGLQAPSAGRSWATAGSPSSPRRACMPTSAGLGWSRRSPRCLSPRRSPTWPVARPAACMSTDPRRSVTGPRA